MLSFNIPNEVFLKLYDSPLNTARLKALLQVQKLSYYANQNGGKNPKTRAILLFCHAEQKTGEYTD